MYMLILGLRSLLYRKNQYTSLFLVCLLGTGISLFCIFLMTGMLSALESKSRVYYGGDLHIMGGKNGQLEFVNVLEDIEKVRGVFGEEAILSERIDFDAKESSFFFEGVSARQRVIKGVDFEKEKDVLSVINYVSGGAEDMAGSNGVILSAPIAEKLGCKVGDEITFMLRSAGGYINTVPLIVHGIFKDSSAFGMYTSYMDIDCIRAAFGYPKTWANRICISFPDGAKRESAETYQERLSQILPMYPLTENKKDFYDAHGNGKEEYALIPLQSNLKEFGVMIPAMRGIFLFIIAMLILIIVAGIGSTYRVIVMKRINEIGIFMAIGMKTKTIILMILSESLFLLLSGFAAGFVLSLVLCALFRAADFSAIPAFDLFLKNGHLAPAVVSSPAVSAVFASVILLTLLAVLSGIWKSIRIMPVRALATTE